MTVESDARESFDVVAVGAHPDDVEIVMGGTIATLTARGLRVLIVDLCDGEPTRYAPHGVFYARLPKWNEVPGGDALADSEPHEIERLFYGHCRMERPWREFDFAVDVTNTYQRKIEAIDVYRSVFCGPQAARLERFRIEDQYVGSLVGVEYAEAFKARSPLLVAEPTVFLKTPFG